MSEIYSIVKYLASLTESQTAVLCTLVSVQGSSYRRPGARLLIINGSLRIGSISGGCLEEDLIVHSKRVVQSGLPEVVIYDTTEENDIVWGVGLGCNGVVHILLERINPEAAWIKDLDGKLRHGKSGELVCIYRASDKSLLGTTIRDNLAPDLILNAYIQVISPPQELVIFGAGDDAVSLYNLAHELGWEVTIADQRPALATQGRFPLAKSIVVASSHELVSKLSIKSGSVCVIMSHHYVHDLPVLKGLLASSCSYIGLLGPKKRAEKLLSDVRSEGLMITQPMLDRLYAPVGLNLGGDTPQTVALCIVAEIQAFLTKCDAKPLKYRNEPIHT